MSWRSVLVATLAAGCGLGACGGSEKRQDGRASLTNVSTASPTAAAPTPAVPTPTPRATPTATSGSASSGRSATRYRFIGVPRLEGGDNLNVLFRLNRPLEAIDDQYANATVYIGKIRANEEPTIYGKPKHNCYAASADNVSRAEPGDVMLVRVSIPGVRKRLAARVRVLSDSFSNRPLRERREKKLGCPFDLP